MTTIQYIDTDYHYGFHVTKYPTMIKTISRIIKETNMSSIQIFSSNKFSKIGPKFNYNDLMLTRKILKYNEIYVVIHGAYIYNLCGTTNGISDNHYHSSLASTLQGLTAELDFGVMINSGVIVHPGSQKNSKEGVETISKSIERVLTRETHECEEIANYLEITKEEVLKRRKIILENAAGEGTKLCSTLEEIATVIKGVKKELRNQIKVCIDTAHSFGRGIYDWGLKGEIERFYEDFDKIIGLKYLEVFHFNDSKVPFKSRKDKHEQLGQGYIFKEREEQIKTFMLEARKHKIMIIGEPPESGLQDWNVVVELLKDTEFPLVEIKNVKQHVIKLIIAGSRTIFDEKRFLDAINTLIIPIYGKNLEIISGGAIGVDQLAKKYAKENNLQYNEYKPIYKSNNDRGAPLRRNIDMANVGDILLAIWDQKSPGTKHMIDYMKNLSKPVIIA